MALRLTASLFCGLLLAACATSGGAGSPEVAASEPTGGSVGDATSMAVGQTREGLADAALSPLEDLNLRKDAIPERLAALETPYDASPTLSCIAIGQEVVALDALLGADWDTPKTEEDVPEAEWAADKASSATLDLVASEARGFIPFRGLVRRATGAHSHAKKYAAAFLKGEQRRAYLKGQGQALGCAWPAAPHPDPGETSNIVFKGDAPHAKPSSTGLE